YTFSLAVSPIIVEYTVFTTCCSGILHPQHTLPTRRSSDLTGTGGNFNVALSSSGISQVGYSTFTVFNLSTGTAYGIEAAAVNSNIPASTSPLVIVTPSTTTFSAGVVVLGFNVYTTSVSIIL